MAYDFEAETSDHVAEVAARLDAVCRALRHRAEMHDASKFSDAERPIYAAVVPRLRQLKYGTPEYDAAVAELGPALRHHHANNSHHPEHYPDGVRGMDLLDLVEMYCDWAAATLRAEQGDMARTLAINAERHAIAGPLRDILANTWRRCGGFSGAPARNEPARGRPANAGGSAVPD